VIVLPGRDDGSFGSPQRFILPSPVALAAGDFNGDQLSDLAVATASAGVVLLLNTTGQ
jgi:hypothetical protein